MKVSNILRKMQLKLPTWFKMRKSNDSIGGRFLNIIGLTIDEVNELLDYMIDNSYISSVDLSQKTILYKCTLPSYNKEKYLIRFKSELIDLKEVKNVREILTGDNNEIDELNELYYRDIYYIDERMNKVYFREAYDKDKKYKDGKIIYVIEDIDGNEIEMASIVLEKHQVWNELDEFGLLLGVKRIFGESNINFKERIMSVFKRPASSSKEGLYNGISRELNLINKMEWKDGGVDIELKENRINIESIMVDNEKWVEDNIYINENGNIVLIGTEDYRDINRDISYIYGISIHELVDDSDINFQNELIDDNRKSKSRFNYYIDLINKKVPIDWNYFLWGEGFWDSIEDKNYIGKVKTFYDSEIINIDE